MNVKRVISIILAAAIVLGLVATGVSVAIAGTEIHEVPAAVTPLAVGEDLPDTFVTGEV